MNATRSKNKSAVSFVPAAAAAPTYPSFQDYCLKTQCTQFSKKIISPQCRKFSNLGSQPKSVVILTDLDHLTDLARSSRQSSNSQKQAEKSQISSTHPLIRRRRHRLSV